jgi:hypothetical protein
MSEKIYARNRNSRDEGDQSLLKDRLGGVGVEPDVKVNSAEALETAQKLAESRLEEVAGTRFRIAAPADSFTAPPSATTSVAKTANTKAQPP